MKIIYNLTIWSYYMAIVIASLFNPKARQWLRGRKNIFKRLKTSLTSHDHLIWIHCASLGEFEQGRPLIEKIKRGKPDIKILLTFFSPSGYEVRKNYEQADYIFYLPPDFRNRARKFIELVNPKYAVFVKYEFWFHYIDLLHRKDIPIYCISAIFRKDQVFFKYYGKWYRNILYKFTYLFVQNEKSKELLHQYHIHNVTVAGDTRFDRVHAIVRQSKDIPIIEKFKQDSPILIAGSSWPADEKLLLRYFNETKLNIKLIIAPHEVHEEKIIQIEKQLTQKFIRFSDADDNQFEDIKVLIINNIGMLSSLYKYSQVAYIGGGFGKGIHNILEAATFGQPVIFGPNYKKFQEAIDLIEAGGAFSITNYAELTSILDNLLSNKDILQVASSRSKNYVESKLGGTQIIFDKIFAQ